MILHSQVSENNQFYVKIKRFNDFKDYIWQELIKTIKQFQDNSFKEEKEFSITTEWVSFLSILNDLADLRDINKFELVCRSRTKNSKLSKTKTSSHQKILILVD